jgi:hypothetical protein
LYKTAIEHNESKIYRQAGVEETEGRAYKVEQRKVVMYY